MNAKGYLLRLMSGNADSVAVSAMHALVDDPDSTCIIKECRDLEVLYGLKYTDSILCGTLWCACATAAGHDGVQAEHVKYGGPTL